MKCFSEAESKMCQFKLPVVLNKLLLGGSPINESVNFKMYSALPVTSMVLYLTFVFTMITDKVIANGKKCCLQMQLDGKQMPLTSPGFVQKLNSNVFQTSELVAKIFIRPFSVFLALLSPF